MQQPSSILDGFEAAWKAWLSTSNRTVDQQPKLTEYLARLDSADAGHAERARELINLDLYYRIKAGETGPLAGQYASLPGFTLSDAHVRELAVEEHKWRACLSSATAQPPRRLRQNSRR
jgi:hypothetical protein